MLSPRIYGLALDINDHEQLRHDPLLAALPGRRKLEEPLAGKNKLNRLKRPGGSKRYHRSTTHWRRSMRCGGRLDRVAIRRPVLHPSNESAHRSSMDLETNFRWHLECQVLEP